MVERVTNRALTDKTVGDSFATMTRVDLLKRLADADIAFAEVNTMADLAMHPHLRRIEVDTPNGKVSYAAPAAIFVGENSAVRRGARDRRARRTSQSSPRGSNRHDRHRGKTRPRSSARQWIGRTTEASDIVTAQLVKGLRATLFQEIGEPKTGDAAPWTTHWCLAQPVFPMSQLEPGRPSDPRRLPAAGAAAAPDVGRRRAGIPRRAARRR